MTTISSITATQIRYPSKPDSPRHPGAEDEHAARTKRFPNKSTSLTPNPRPLRPAHATAAACKKRFCLLFRRLWKVGRPQARSARRNEVEVEVDYERRPHLGHGTHRSERRPPYRPTRRRAKAR